MENQPAASPLPSGALLAALAIGIMTITLVNGLLSAWTPVALNLRDEWPIYLLQAAIVAFPFVILAFFEQTSKLVWVFGLALTAAFWGYYLFDGLNDTGEGANIGLGLLLLISPLIITGACFLVARLKFR